jgi:hypothetical protein
MLRRLYYLLLHSLITDYLSVNYLSRKKSPSINILFIANETDCGETDRLGLSHPLFTSAISHVFSCAVLKTPPVQASKLPYKTSMALSFNGHTVVVTGAGGGLGKAYAHSICNMFTSMILIYSYSLLFASRGANVVVNDFNPTAAQKVVDEIVKGSAIVYICIFRAFLNLDS